MAFAQGVQQLAGNVVGDVKAWKLDAAAKETSERLLKGHPDYARLTQTQLSEIVQSDPGYKAVAAQWGTGGTYSMVATAVAGALGGLSASNLGAAAGGAMAPYSLTPSRKPRRRIILTARKTPTPWPTPWSTRWRARRWRRYRAPAQQRAPRAVNWPPGPSWR
ncbi:hypothetical protein [Pantoea piersonii]|uniref:hypothetical protein n=1 Tax=Pantoea piersonii TaxID=2364647 RepID=UPI0022F176F6|nr:hypothetical protein [Pantoea piersonii]WBV23225.1 hypothetical protein PG877_08835 [Pantoea piersonii]